MLVVVVLELYCPPWGNCVCSKRWHQTEDTDSHNRQQQQQKHTEHRCTHQHTPKLLNVAYTALPSGDTVLLTMHCQSSCRSGEQQEELLCDDGRAMGLRLRLSIIDMGALVLFIIGGKWSRSAYPKTEKHGCISESFQTQMHFRNFSNIETPLTQS